MDLNHLLFSKIFLHWSLELNIHCVPTGSSNICFVLPIIVCSSKKSCFFIFYHHGFTFILSYKLKNTLVDMFQIILLSHILGLWCRVLSPGHTWGKHINQWAFKSDSFVLDTCKKLICSRGIHDYTSSVFV